MVDLTDPDALAGVEAVVGDADRYGGRAFGVYLRPLELGDDGYPVTALVELRDRWGGGRVTVPYAALRPAPSGMHELP